MELNASLRRRDAEIEAQPCRIEDIVELSESEYASLYQNLMRDRDYIAERSDLMGYRDGVHHCILALGENQEDGILIQSDGMHYADRYAFIPCARELVDAHIRQLADYVVSESTAHSEDGTWSVSYEELYQHFGASITDTNGNGKLLQKELQQREETNALLMTEDCIEMTCHLEYCEHCQQGGLSGAMSLLSLMGCNLYDVHPVCAGSDAGCESIARLNADTLTTEGKQEWSDVLDAKVKSLRPGAGCIHLELAGCDAKRLSSFARMLDGQCDAEDYERWVRQDGISYASPGAVPELSPTGQYSAVLVATYEELFHIPDEQRTTDYFGDYGTHHFRYGITGEQIRPVYNKALAAMEMTEEEFRACYDADKGRGEIIGRMRDCLLAKELKAGEELLFVATEPYGGPGDFCLRGGILLDVNREDMTCRMKGEFFTMEDVPLHYILGRYSEAATEKHYGLNHVEPLFGEHPALAHQYLREAEEAWEQKWNSEQAQEEETGPALSM